MIFPVHWSPIKVSSFFFNAILMKSILKRTGSKIYLYQTLIFLINFYDIFFTKKLQRTSFGAG